MFVSRQTIPAGDTAVHPVSTKRDCFALLAMTMGGYDNGYLGCFVGDGLLPKGDEKTSEQHKKVPVFTGMRTKTATS